MRAAVYTRSGPPADVLSVAEVAEPHAGPGQVRIAVRAAGVNPVDWKIVSGRTPAAATVPGIDAAGVVDEVGDGVTGVQLGDAVFGYPIWVPLEYLQAERELNVASENAMTTTTGTTWRRSRCSRRPRVKPKSYSPQTRTSNRRPSRKLTAD